MKVPQHPNCRCEMAATESIELIGGPFCGTPIMIPSPLPPEVRLACLRGNDIRLYWGPEDLSAPPLLMAVYRRGRTYRDGSTAYTYSEELSCLV